MANGSFVMLFVPGLVTTIMGPVQFYCFISPKAISQLCSMIRSGKTIGKDELGTITLIMIYTLFFFGGCWLMYSAFDFYDTGHETERFMAKEKKPLYPHRRSKGPFLIRFMNAWYVSWRDDEGFQWKQDDCPKEKLRRASYTLRHLTVTEPVYEIVPSGLAARFTKPWYGTAEQVAFHCKSQRPEARVRLQVRERSMSMTLDYEYVSQLPYSRLVSCTMEDIARLVTVAFTRCQCTDICRSCAWDEPAMSRRPFGGRHRFHKPQDGSDLV